MPWLRYVASPDSHTVYDSTQQRDTLSTSLLTAILWLNHAFTAGCYSRLDLCLLVLLMLLTCKHVVVVAVLIFSRQQ